MAFTDGTFTSPVQDGPKRVFYPFANAATKDTTTKGTARDYVVLPGSFSPAAALSTDPDDATQYLIDETEPRTDMSGFYRFTRTFAKIPAQQVNYGSRLLVRPVMNDIKSGTDYAVSFDGGETSHRFSSRVAVSAVGNITTATVTKNNAAETFTDFSSGTFDVQDTAGATTSQFFTSSASALHLAVRTACAAITGLAISKGIGTLTISWTGGMRSIGTTTSGIAIEGSAGSGSITFRVATAAVTGAQTEIISQPTRAIVTGSAHSGAAGEWMAAWNGDKLVGIIKPISASGTSITIAADEAPWQVSTLAITHVAFAGQAAARYVNGPISVSTKEVTDFYLPGVSIGITTPADIALVSPKTDPVSWLGEIVAGTAWVAIEGSQLGVWRGPIYQQTTIYAQMSDALDTVSVSA